MWKTAVVCIVPFFFFFFYFTLCYSLWYQVLCRYWIGATKGISVLIFNIPIVPRFNTSALLWRSINRRKGETVSWVFRYLLPEVQTVRHTTGNSCLTGSVCVNYYDYLVYSWQLLRRSINMNMNVYFSLLDCWNGQVFCQWTGGNSIHRGLFGIPPKIWQHIKRMSSTVFTTLLMHFKAGSVPLHLL